MKTRKYNNAAMVKIYQREPVTAGVQGQYFAKVTLGHNGFEQFRHKDQSYEVPLNGKGRSKAMKKVGRFVRWKTGDSLCLLVDSEFEGEVINAHNPRPWGSRTAGQLVARSVRDRYKRTYF